MKYPNKLKNAARALTKETAQRLRLEPDELLELHAWCAIESTGVSAFCACCLFLEDPFNELPPEDSRSTIIVEGITDRRYAVVYHMIDSFLTKPENFWKSPKELAVKATETASPAVSLHEMSFELFGSESPKQIVRFGDRPTIKWNEEQSKAFHDIFDWLRDSKGKQVYRLFGFAGVGKTSMIQEISYCIQNGERGIPKGEVLFAAYTGKAAAVMLSKGCAGAQTIHSLIYKVKIDQVTGRVEGYIRNTESPLANATLLVLDEVSMVDEEVAADLLRFGVRILVVGDPGQLDPIKGEGYFTQSDADSMLIKVERVAKENPLIYLATRIRERKRIKPGWYGDTQVIASGARISDEHISLADQMLVGRNKTRIALNKRYRQLTGAFDVDTQFPIKGDRLMCLKNNKLTGVLNGTQWICSEPEVKPVMRLKDPKKPLLGFERTNIDGLHFYLRSQDLFDTEGNPYIIRTVCSTHHFDETLPAPPWRDIAGTDEFTFAYASTIHKAQGSQWAKTLLIDESALFTGQEWKHFYTGLTRASESSVVYLDH